MAEQDAIRVLNEKKAGLLLKIQELSLEVSRIDIEIMKAGGVLPAQAVFSPIAGTIGGTIGGTLAATEADPKRAK